eukprot:scaffold69443_cov58-Attheya_sp.AAC.1
MSQDKKLHNTLANTATNHGDSIGSHGSHGQRRPLHACPPYQPLHTGSSLSLITSYLVQAHCWSFARDVWSMHPKEMQIPALTSLVDVDVSGGKVLLVVKTGAGKSHVMRTTGVLLGGVCLIIMLLLALGSDQVVKLHTANQEFGSVKYFHLDKYLDRPMNMAAILPLH